MFRKIRHYFKHRLFNFHRKCCDVHFEKDNNCKTWHQHKHHQHTHHEHFCNVVCDQHSDTHRHHIKHFCHNAFQHHSYDGVASLNCVKLGLYKFVCVHYSSDENLGHRLLEMGFIPGEDVKVVSNSGMKGSVMIEIKGSKLALSNKIAENILVTNGGQKL